MVDIHLDHVPSNTRPLVLSIPLDDVQRLSIRPLKWFRFIMFAICGAKGDLFQLDTAGEFQLVNYSTTIVGVVGPYYYKPDGPCMLIDYNLFAEYNPCDGESTSSVSTDRERGFRQDVIDRDGSHCILTGAKDYVCDACYLIPRPKGDEYIDLVTRLRADLYDQPLPLNDINSAANGILLRADRRAYFGCGELALLKTPNFAMDPEDIPGFQGPPPANRVTAQYLKLPVDELTLCKDANYDNLRPRGGNEAPAAILLDFSYGAAAYNTWGNGEEMMSLLHETFVDQYQSIPLLQKPIEPLSGEDPGISGGDGDHMEPQAKSQPRKRYDAKSPSQSSRGLGGAVDAMNAFMMRVSGITPEARMAHYRKEEEQRQLRETKTSQTKVLEWMEQL